MKIKTPKKDYCNKILADSLKKIRIVNELTQKSFGQLFQPPVTQSTIARWEMGEQKPDPIHFPKIAYFLDLTLDELHHLMAQASLDVESLSVEKKSLTPNKKHLKILLKGVKYWNSWREKNPDIVVKVDSTKSFDFGFCRT